MTIQDIKPQYYAGEIIKVTDRLNPWKRCYIQRFCDYGDGGTAVGDSGIYEMLHEAHEYMGIPVADMVFEITRG